MKIRKIITVILLLIPIVNFAQSGGRGVYKFLELTNSSRVASLGGTNVSLIDDDLNFAFHNPALLSRAASNHFILNYIGYFADIKYGYVGYAFDFQKFGTFSFGIHSVDYGDFKAADEIGNITGDFTAKEYAFNLIWSKQITDKFTFGINLKPVLSQLETYKSYGIASDWGLSYNDSEKNFSAGLVLKNIGTQLKAYHDDNKEPLPFDVQFGVTKKLAHAPFRVNLTAHHLYKWDLLYNIPETSNTSLFDTQNTDKGNKLQDILDNSLRHLIFGIEFTPFKSFYANIAYNHKMRKEMSIEGKGGFVGFSWGLGLKLKKFSIGYGRASYHISGGSNHFSLGINLSEFKKKTKLENLN